jgi:hypothetical protein
MRIAMVIAGDRSCIPSGVSVAYHPLQLGNKGIACFFEAKATGASHSVFALYSPIIATAI